GTLNGVSLINWFLIKNLSLTDIHPEIVFDEQTATFYVGSNTQ
ncbi:unnamed protein product, partial [Didymodactylos carnosus]